MKSIRQEREVRDFHPLVESYLIANGYTYKHEVVMPDHGRVDFVANKLNTKTLLIECKPDPRDISEGIIQVVGYRTQVNNSNAAIATSKHIASMKILNMCSKYNVELIQVDKVFNKVWPTRITHIGDFLYGYMRENDTNMFAVAKKVGVANTTISSVLYGKHAPSIPLLVKLAKLTNHDIYDLIEMAYPEVKEIV